MKHAKILSALGLMAVAGAANAGVTSTWTVATDYDFRGISQNAKDPVIQASLDYAHSSGAYAGLWVSTVDFADGEDKANGGNKDPKSQEWLHLERDVYAGFANKFAEDFNYDLGAVYYTYNDNDLNFAEAYASLAYKSWVKAKVFYAPDFGGRTTSGQTSAYAASLDGTLPLSKSGFSILAHAGYNGGEYWHATPGDTKSRSTAYVDYSAGVGYVMGKLNWALKYVDTTTTTSKGNRVTSDFMNNENRVILSVATTFPW